MGKTCSKDAQSPRESKTEGIGPQSPVYEYSDHHRYSYSERGGTENELDVSRQVSVQPEASFTNPEIRPPHSVLKESIRDLSKTHRFYVHLYNLKARNLKLRNAEALAFCVVNWDDFSFERRTHKMVAGSNPRWGNSMQFYYSVPSLTELKEKSVVLQVYEEYGSKSRIIGQTVVNLMTIASGPIHHDLRLHEPVARHSAKTSNVDAGRLIFDLRMAQVCQLMISPIEVLVHLRESLDALDQLEVEGVGTQRPERIRATKAMTRTANNTITTTTPVTPPPTERNLLLSSRSRTKTPSNDSESISPAIRPSLSLTNRRWDSRNATSNGALEDPDASVKIRQQLSNVESEGDREDVVENVLDALASGGHSEADDVGPFLAEWQLTFLPTDVDNPVEFCSAFTTICDQPYWNAVDHTMINKVMATSTEYSMNELRSLGKSVAHTNVAVLSMPQTSLSSDLSQLPPTSPDTHPSSKTNYEHLLKLSRTAIASPKTQLRHIPLSVSDLKSSSPSNTLHTKDITNNNIEATTNENEIASQPITPSIKAAGPIPPSVLVHQLSAAHLDHIDPQATYRQLAAICRSGRLVRELLYDDLPTIQLETTSNFLRQNHLKLRLYAKRLGFQAPKFYGEAWLPFFKIYEADVVEQMHQNFSDSYFHEKLWYEGKCIGHIEGIIVFQNNPMVRQMLAGVNTDEGFMRISPPVLGADHKSVKFVFRSQDIIPEEVTRISQLNQSLLELLYCKGQHAFSEVGLAAITQIPTKAKLPFLTHKRNPKVPAENTTNRKELQRLSPHAKAPETMVQASQQEFHNVCDQILQILRISHVETRRSFLYQNQHALLIGQRVFLNLADHVLEFSDYVPWQYRSTYSAILHQTLRRGELDIGSCLPQPPAAIGHLSVEDRSRLHTVLKTIHNPQSSVSLLHDDSITGQKGNNIFVYLGMPHPKNQQPTVPPTAVANKELILKSLSKEAEQTARTLTVDDIETIQLYHKRMKLCRQYFLALSRVLNYCLAKLCNDCVFEGQRKYLSIFLCICYFRLPEFRTQLLEAIMTSEERKLSIEEWRGTEYELDAATLSQLEKWQPGFEHCLLLDWSPFHQAINAYFGEESLKEALKSIPEAPEEWKIVLSQRLPSFFSFLEHWAKHVYQTIPHKKALRWHFLPGYPTLLKAMLIEMKIREVTKYPDALLNCSGALLANERLLSVFIKVLFLKTCVFDTSAVFASLNYVDYWIQVLTLRDQPLPPNFDLNFLRRGLDIVLGSDIGLCIAKGLWFIYKNLPTFKQAQLRVFVIDLLMDKYFFTLFLSWSWLVRRCFMWFLLYRVCEPTRIVLTRETPLELGASPASGGATVAKEQKIAVSQLRLTLTTEEQTMVLGYLELSRYLNFLNAPPVFPKPITRKKLSVLLIDGTASQTRSKSESLPDQPLEEPKSRPAAKTSDSEFCCLETTANPGNNNNNNNIHHNTTAHSRTPLALSDVVERVKRLSEDIDNTDSQIPEAEQRHIIPEHCRVYIKSAVPEFIAELQVYRSWVAAGADPLPTMNIPASPLDNNVDVPADSWQ